MKKVGLLLVIISFLLSVGSSHAVDFGAKLGMTVSSHDFDYTQASVPDFDDRNGIEIGAFVQHSVHRHLTVSVEAHYLQVGVKDELVQVDYSGDTIGTVEISPHVNYLSIPVYLKGRLPVGQFTPYLFAGPRVDIKIGQGGEGFDVLYDEFGEFTMGVTFGAGGEVAFSPKMSLLFEMAYSPELAEVYKTDLLTMKNKSLSFLVGVVF